jgi:hypothetical protein
MGQRPKHIKKSVAFPRLDKKNHFVISDRDTIYNCIAYVVGVTTIKWWPALPLFRSDVYWPLSVPSIETLDAFLKAFGTHGYVECENGDFIEATEKISIYTKDGTRGGKPTHAAKQLDEQNWASKLGDAYDICHKERAVGGGIYGEIAAYMRRTKI